MFAGKVVLVTGGSRGIGAAVVSRFLREQATVYSISRHLAETGPLGPNHHPEVCDVTVEADVSAVIGRIVAKGSLHVLVNNAGVERSAVFLRQTSADYDAVFNTHVRAVLHMTRAVLRASDMMRRKDGVVVNIGSVVGTQGNAGQVLYSASKSALHGITRSLCQEYGRFNVRFNTVAPGYIETAMTNAMEPKA